MRWIIRGGFEVKSPMSIHTGSPEDAWPASHPADEINDLVSHDVKKSIDHAPVQGIELDAEGFPVLPASAIKGLLRGLASECTDAGIAEKIKRLFGELPTPTGQGNQQSPTGGVIEVRTARLAHGTVGKTRPALRGKTELFEGTRTADDGQLRSDRVVAPGAWFSAEFVLTRGTRADVEVLLGLLDRVDGASSRSAFGSSTSQGDGRAKWKKKKVFVFGKDEALQWLKSPTSASWETCAREVEVKSATPSFDDGVVLEIPLTIEVDGHFLVSAWGTYIGEDDKGAPATKPIRRPFRVAVDDEKTARLPGSSLDGALRAQARRIFRTMSGDAAPWHEDDSQLPEAFASLFGSATQASFLEVATLVHSGLEPVRQEFVAIDRFSGGVSGDKKFALEAFEQPELTGTIRLRLLRRVDPALTGKLGVMSCHSLKPAAVGLLALVLKDLATGDIPLGHATRKGYGGVRKLTSRGADWKTVLHTLGEQIVANADTVEGFDVFKGRTGEDALRHAVELLRFEALTWAASRPAAQAGGSQ